jgi:hypothetical protein
MGRTSIIGILGSILLAVSLFAFSQDYNQPPKSPKADALPGQQLIVWSETQKPQPVPASSDEMYPTAQGTQLVNGIILTRGSDSLFAAENGGAYRIDNNKDQLKAFTQKKVRIRGKIDASSRVVHIVAIQLR